MKLQFKIQKVNIEESKRIIVVSDIHGMDPLSGGCASEDGLYHRGCIGDCGRRNREG